MKKLLSVIFTIGLSACVFCGCSMQIKYGGTDTNGNTAADIVKMYYESLNNDEDEMSYFAESYKNRNVKQQDIMLKELSNCILVEKEDIRASDREWERDTREDYYAYCFVQTSDVIICKEDGALGTKNEEVRRDYAYTLVMETKDSEWKIYDFGYPPYYVSEK